MIFIASSLFPRIPLGFSSGLGAFRGTPNPPHLESLSSKSDKITWKLTMFAYRRLQHSIISKALEYGVPIVIVDPRDTSKTCPRCGEKLVHTHRLGICKRCGFTCDRDSIGAVNIWLKALYAYAGEPGSPLRAPAVKDETRLSGGTKDEGMKKAITSIHR